MGGLAPFWRGNLANVIRYFPTQALNFTFKDTIKAVFACPKEASATRKFATNIASGGFAGTLSLCFVYSLDMGRTRLANDAKGKDGKRQYNGLIDVFRKTMATDGIRGIYKGFVISAVGIFVYRGLYFGLYDTLKPLFLGENASAFMSFFLGWAVTIVSGLASYPIDTGMQILKNEGFMSMMKGAGANVLRGVAGAGVLVGCDVVKAAYANHMYG